MATLTVTNPSLETGDNLYFSWSGFRPNSPILIGVVGGGYTNLASNASGAGSSYFPSISEGPGTYTLYAQDWLYNYAEDTFTVIAVTVVFKGSIRKQELDYKDSWQAFPLYNIPAGTRIRVRITGRNDMATTQRMGIYWTVKDHDGVKIQEYSTWEAWPYTGAGSTHEFIGGGFDLNKEGLYTIQAVLIMNPADEVVVDDYYGTLCTVEAAVSEPEFSGFAIAAYERT